MPNVFDFNPQNINPYPYWKWNKVLPAVYDDSLSQYEILCKLLDTVNNIISSTNSTGEQVEQLTQLVQQLIDGEFPSGIVQYVEDIAEAAIADDVATINSAITNLSNQIAAIRETICPISYYGAVGDGVTDDTNAANQAFAGNKAISLESGSTYRMTDVLTIGDNTVIYGNGATIKFTNNVNDTKFITGSSLKNCTFYDVIFDFGANSVATYGISFIGSSNISFCNCSFKNAYGGVFRLNDASNIIIKNCNFINITGTSGMPGEAIYAQNLVNSIFDSCYFDNIYDHCFYFAGITDSYGITISNCICHNTGIGALTNSAAICLYANIHDCVIENIILKSCNMGMYIGNYSSYTTLPYNININNITGSDFDLNGITINGLSSNNVKNISVSNVSIDTITQDGIRVDYIEDSTFNNITVHSCSRNGFCINGALCCVFSNIVSSAINCFVVQRTATDPHSQNCIFAFIVCSAQAGSQNGFYHRNGDNNKISNVIAQGTFSSYKIMTSGLNILVDNANSSFNSLTFDDGNSETYHKVGDLVVFPNASSGQPLIALCTANGIPGTLTTVLSRP